MVWDNYQHRIGVGEKADFIIGQSSEDTRSDNILGGAGFHVVDDHNRLWTYGSDGKLLIYQLPLKPDDEPIALSIDLFWIDDSAGDALDYRCNGIAFRFNSESQDKNAIYISDLKNHRILRIGNYNSFGDKLFVDMVIGQPDKSTVLCNHDQEYYGLFSLLRGDNFLIILIQ